MARYDDRRANMFLALWTLAVVATASAFLFYLAVRVQTVDTGYELGRAHGEVARLREVERVLELELSAHETPERVDLISRTLFGMEEPAPERVFSAGSDPVVEPSDSEEGAVAEHVAADVAGEVRP